LATSFLHPCDTVDDVVGTKGDMLNTGTSPVINVLLNLRFSLTSSWLINWHLNILIEIRHNNRSQSRKLCVEHLIINRPKSMEIQHFFVPCSSGFHFTIGLVPNAVINKLKLWLCNQFVEWLRKMMGLESWEENTCVVDSLDKSMGGITIGLD